MKPTTQTRATICNKLHTVLDKPETLKGGDIFPKPKALRRYIGTKAETRKRNGC